MITKSTIFSIALLSIISNNIFAMNEKDNTLIRSDGYWTPKKETCLTKITAPDHQREDYYKYTKYIAESWCTISNAGLFVVAHSIKNSYPLSAAALTCAGTASAISHAIPYHSLNVIDRILAVTSVATVVYDANIYKMATLSAALKNPIILTSLMATGVTALTDHYIAHGKEIVEKSNGLISPSMIIERKSSHKWIHVLWHILAAWTAYTLLTN